MPNDNNACIRYLMKEMDPSEEILIERAMMEDEDLLIEVECMRQTLKRLDNELPMLDPPPHITEQIKQKAAEQKPVLNSGRNRFKVRGFQYAAAAAVVIFGLLSGVLWLQTETTAEESNTATESSENRNAAVSSMSNYAVPSLPQEQLEPWVDRNEVLRFQDQFNGGRQAEFDSILNISTNKLRLIKEPLHTIDRSRVLQMTGSDK